MYIIVLRLRTLNIEQQYIVIDFRLVLGFKYIYFVQCYVIKLANLVESFPN